MAIFSVAMVRQLLEVAGGPADSFPFVALYCTDARARADPCVSFQLLIAETIVSNLEPDKEAAAEQRRARGRCSLSLVGFSRAGRSVAGRHES